MKNSRGFKNFSAIIAYKGTPYCGWQSQLDKKGIQDVIQNVIYNVFAIENKIIGASRTDAGVHAEGQVAKLLLPDIDVEYLKKIINKALPADILIRHLTECSADFSPRYCAKSKIYKYCFSLHKPEPNIADYVLYYPYKCDLQIVSEILSMFVGTHDFRSFCTKPQTENTIRTIFKCELSQQSILNNGINTVIVEGDSFLRYMVRRIVGAAITAGTKQYGLQYMKKIFESKNPANHMYNLPPHGLTLVEIKF